MKGWIRRIRGFLLPLLFAIAIVKAAPALSEGRSITGSVSVPNGSGLEPEQFSLVTERPDRSVLTYGVRSNGRFSVQRSKARRTGAAIAASSSYPTTSATIGTALKNTISAVYNSVYYGPVVLGIKEGDRTYSFNSAKKSGICSSSTARAVLGVNNSKKKIGTARLKLQIDNDLKVAYSKNRLRKSALSESLNATVGSDCAPTGAKGKLGQRDAEGTAQQPAMLSAAANEVDPNDPDGDGVLNSEDRDDDNDGIQDIFDIDNDNDGIIDNDDPDNNDSITDAQNSFYLFSNFHLNFEDSLNANAMSITKELIDSRLVANGGLAVQVVGTGASDEAVELDCGGLNYCSTGGTGRTKEPFPDGVKFPEDLDSDGDGKGTITRGSSNDFQLSTKAPSDKIKAGDVFVQELSVGGGTPLKFANMLNFIFHTTPAVKEVVTDVQSYPITYPVSSGDPGTIGNCFEVPDTGEVSVTLTAWRPQRPGNAAAGESSFVDLGNLRVIINMPNAPCPLDESTGFCFPDFNEAGPGVCPGLSSIYTSFDSNLSLTSDGLQDRRGDSNASPTNTFQFTINISQCLSQAGMSWDARELVFFPFQMMNQYGDNAVQNLCFVRKEP